MPCRSFGTCAAYAYASAEPLHGRAGVPAGEQILSGRTSPSASSGSPLRVRASSSCVRPWCWRYVRTCRSESVRTPTDRRHGCQHQLPGMRVRPSWHYRSVPRAARSTNARALPCNLCRSTLPPSLSCFDPFCHSLNVGASATTTTAPLRSRGPARRIGSSHPGCCRRARCPVGVASGWAADPRVGGIHVHDAGRRRGMGFDTIGPVS